MAKLNHYSADAPASLSDILLFEVDRRWSREHGVFAATEEKVPMGAVLCLNANGEYVLFGQSSPDTETSKNPESASTEDGQSSSAESAPAEGTQTVEAQEAETADAPCAILISKEIEPSLETQDCVVIRRGACVAAANLYWPDSVTDEQKKTALATLAALGIVPKE